MRDIFEYKKTHQGLQSSLLLKEKHLARVTAIFGSLKKNLTNIMVIFIYFITFLMIIASLFIFF